MNKKIMIGCISLILMLMAISFATAVNSSNTTVNEEKETPLFNIRTRLAIGERSQDLTVRFLRQRTFFLPLQWLRNKIHEDSTTTPILPPCITSNLKTGCTPPPTCS